MNIVLFYCVHIMKSFSEVVVIGNAYCKYKAKHNSAPSQLIKNNEYLLRLLIHHYKYVTVKKSSSVIIQCQIRTHLHQHMGPGYTYRYISIQNKENLRSATIKKKQKTLLSHVNRTASTCKFVSHWQFQVSLQLLARVRKQNIQLCREIVG